MKTWRLIIDNGVSASFGLAADETLANRVGKGLSPPTLRLYTYRPYCALAGRFQNIENEIQVEYCLQNDIQINRRPTGGGAIIMGHEQLGVALMIPAQGENSHSSTRELMRRFSTGLIAALGEIGIRATFQRKNDLEVDGRKIAGLGIYRDPGGGLLFHASLLIDLDVALMLKILRTPFEKISDKEIKTVASRISTVRKESGVAISLDEVRAQVAKSYTATFDVVLQQGCFSQIEKRAIHELEKRKYCTNNWVFQSSEVSDHNGSAKCKTSGGLLDIRVTMAGHILKAVYISGDFFASEHAIADLEASLRWHVSDRGRVTETVQKVYARRESELEMLPQADLIESILAAVKNATGTKSKSPYGCFVTPGSAHV
jgi:lipoate-protein ligase A